METDRKNASPAPAAGSPFSWCGPPSPDPDEHGLSTMEGFHSPFSSKSHHRDPIRDNDEPQRKKKKSSEKTACSEIDPSHGATAGNAMAQKNTQELQREAEFTEFQRKISLPCMPFHAAQHQHLLRMQQQHLSMQGQPQHQQLYPNLNESMMYQMQMHRDHSLPGLNQPQPSRVAAPNAAHPNPMAHSIQIPAGLASLPYVLGVKNGYNTVANPQQHAYNFMQSQNNFPGVGAAVPQNLPGMSAAVPQNKLPGMNAAVSLVDLTHPENHLSVVQSAEPLKISMQQQNIFLQPKINLHYAKEAKPSVDSTERQNNAPETQAATPLGQNILQAGAAVKVSADSVHKNLPTTHAASPLVVLTQPQHNLQVGKAAKPSVNPMQLQNNMTGMRAAKPLVDLTQTQNYFLVDNSAKPAVDSMQVQGSLPSAKASGSIPLNLLQPEHSLPSEMVVKSPVDPNNLSGKLAQPQQKLPEVQGVHLPVKKRKARRRSILCETKMKQVVYNATGVTQPIIANGNMKNFAKGPHHAASVRRLNSATTVQNLVEGPHHFSVRRLNSATSLDRMPQREFFHLGAVPPTQYGQPIQHPGAINMANKMRMSSHLQHPLFAASSVPPVKQNPTQPLTAESASATLTYADLRTRKGSASYEMAFPPNSIGCSNIEEHTKGFANSTTPNSSNLAAELKEKKKSDCLDDKSSTQQLPPTLHVSDGSSAMQNLTGTTNRKTLGSFYALLQSDTTNAGATHSNNPLAEPSERRKPGSFVQRSSAHSTLPNVAQNNFTASFTNLAALRDRTSSAPPATALPPKYIGCSVVKDTNETAAPLNNLLSNADAIHGEKGKKSDKKKATKKSSAKNEPEIRRKKAKVTTETSKCEAASVASENEVHKQGHELQNSSSGPGVTLGKYSLDSNSAELTQNYLLSIESLDTSGPERISHAVERRRDCDARPSPSSTIGLTVGDDRYVIDDIILTDRPKSADVLSNCSFSASHTDMDCQSKEELGSDFADVFSEQHEFAKGDDDWKVKNIIDVDSTLINSIKQRKSQLKSLYNRVKNSTEMDGFESANQLAATSSSQPANNTRDEWSCIKCGSGNTSFCKDNKGKRVSRKRCKKCKAWRDLQSSSSHSINKTEFQLDEATSVEKSEKWNCMSCGFSNSQFSKDNKGKRVSRKRCEKCRTSRSSELQGRNKSVSDALNSDAPDASHALSKGAGNVSFSAKQAMQMLPYGTKVMDKENSKLHGSNKSVSVSDTLNSDAPDDSHALSKGAGDDSFSAKQAMEMLSNGTNEVIATENTSAALIYPPDTHIRDSIQDNHSFGDEGGSAAKHGADNVVNVEDNSQVKTSIAHNLEDNSQSSYNTTAMPNISSDAIDPDVDTAKDASGSDNDGVNHQDMCRQTSGLKEPCAKPAVAENSGNDVPKLRRKSKSDLPSNADVNMAKDSSMNDNCDPDQEDKDVDDPKEPAAAENIVNTVPVDISPPSEVTVAPCAGKRLDYEYPYAPMGQIWLNPSLCTSKSRKDTTDLTPGGTLIGRRWVWDEGYFIDAKFNPGLVPRKIPLPSGCTCGANHFTMSKLTKSSSVSDTTNGGRTRRSERSGASARMASVISQLASNTLSPHTLVSCEEYTHGPEFRFSETIPSEDVQPFSVRVGPDATFLADLHAHLSDSEIIGFLGGYYSHEEKCVFIQAAFPCKSTDRTDSGQTDVEMDPVSQIYAREAIDTHGMSVVGWYHSHPTFQPDPSVTDIENQANYQQLFAESFSESDDSVVPFVGLIVGTYDGRNPTSQSVMRWFHVRDQTTATYKSVHYPMNLKITNRSFRKMADDDPSSVQVRKEMTISGADIRKTLETNYLSCPLTDCPPNHYPVKAAAFNNTTVTTQKSTDRSCEGNGVSQDQEIQFSTSSYVLQKEPILTTQKGKESSLLLSEAMFTHNVQIKDTWKFHRARPLYFTDREKSIFGVLYGTDSYDVIGGMIWHAVEREQRMQGATPVPASSSAVFELILRQSFLSFRDFDRKLYALVHCIQVGASDTFPLETSFDDSDAVLSHNVDVLVSHYSSKREKISPFATWSGAGDKGNIAKGCGPFPVDDPNLWRDFYLTEVLNMQRVEANGGVTYQGGHKMRRGHKMAACLLKWASDMQLSPNFGSIDEDSDMNRSIPFDHEIELHQETTKCAQERSQASHYYFVAEIMRLVAAKWRESKDRSSSSTPIKRRGRS